MTKVKHSAAPTQVQARMDEIQRILNAAGGSSATVEIVEGTAVAGVKKIEDAKE